MNAEPLLKFSPYTVDQIGTLKSLGREIEEILDSSIQVGNDGSVDVERSKEVYSKFWLWTLGAFEVTRTMESAKACFSADVHSRFRDFKIRLVKLRIPFTKQQLAGRREVARGEASVYGIDGNKKDFLFKIEGNKYWVRELLQEFTALVDGIKRRDVLMSYPDFLNPDNG